MPYKDPEKRKEVKRKYEQKRLGKRTRGWACVAWRDSAPKDWIERLAEEHIQVLISPIHDQDITYDEATDVQSLKKPHWHVLAMYDQPVSESVAQRLFAAAGICLHADGTPAPPEQVRTIKGYARYLVHMDDPDKHRYEERDVLGLCGADWWSVALDKGEVVERLLDEIEAFVFAEGYDSYSLLMQYAREYRPDWLQVLRKRTIHIKAYVQSYAYDVSGGLVIPPVKSPAWQRLQLALQREDARRR